MTYSYKIESIEAFDNQEFNNIIISIIWTKTLEHDGLIAVDRGSTFFNPENIDSTNFIDFQSLTPTVVESWIETKTDRQLMDKINTRLQMNIHRMIAPVKLVQPPWVENKSN